MQINGCKQSVNGGITLFELGCQGLTVIGWAVRMLNRHGLVEDSKTVAADSRFGKCDRPEHILIGSYV